MLIMSQSRKILLNLGSISELFLSSAHGGDYDGGPVKVLASYPIAEDVNTELGTYENEVRAVEVLEEVVVLYEKYKSTIQIGGNGRAMTFAFAPPKVYRMPEK